MMVLGVAVSMSVVASSFSSAARRVARDTAAAMF